jgi:Zn finger protein HypA/HybF involved in hydrogenase expression
MRRYIRYMFSFRPFPVTCKACQKRCAFHDHNGLCADCQARIRRLVMTRRRQRDSPIQPR